ncbi:MAG: sigma-70 family RNA polymerase sigma factor [Hydrogenophaga sp.]|uniref:sigma-70 family RNA polymerase sigma factor n=1 Tax=Hydrogenophaga sp. TaxID=1904254 RepID=UPI001DCA051E|nr:sigma-70 family RNA polymerase sigma factor [Hydrogenophaga sp.]MBX3609328.1 sigma-70 family RNA polymerase sigma factor [Hydrogenophaga sp.]
MQPPPTSDFDHAAALADCARGDRSALRALYEREGRFLLGVALRIVRDRAAAEDVLHDAFVSIWTRAASFDPARGDARGWITSIVRHRALDVVRAGARQVAVDDDGLDALLDADAAAVATPDMAEAFALSAGLGRLDDCLARLDSAKRNCVLYAYVDGCTHGEIAERLGAPLGSVKAWIRRGLLALRECLA